MINNIVFKLVNLFALLGYLLNIIALLSAQEYYGPSAEKIVNGIFHLFSLVALLFLEFNNNPVISGAVPFLFSFVGRGIFYIWLAWTTFSVSVISIIGSIFTFVVGIVYIALFALKNSPPPSQYNSYDDTLFASAAKFLSGEDNETSLPLFNDAEESGPSKNVA